MKKPRQSRGAVWSRERWLWILLALIYVALLVQALCFGDWFGAPDARPAAAAEQVLFLPTNAPPRSAPLTSPRPESESGRKKLNINQADAWMLTAIPGVGEAMAQRIIDYRDAHGGMVALEELRRISGVGEKLYATLSEYLEIR